VHLNRDVRISKSRHCCGFGRLVAGRLPSGFGEIDNGAE